MMRGKPLFILALGLSGAAMSAPPPATPGTVAKAAIPTQPAPAAPANRRVTMSPEGNAIAKQIIGAPDPRMAEIRTEMGKIRDQKLQIISAPNVDVDKLEQMFRREEALQAEFVKRQNDRLLSLLRALPAADKLALLQTLANPAKLPAAATPPMGTAPAQPAKPARTN